MNKNYWREAVERLQQSGLTQVNIAAAIGMSRTGLNDIACGKTREPTGWSAVRLHALDVRVAKRRNK